MFYDFLKESGNIIKGIIYNELISNKMKKKKRNLR